MEALFIFRFIHIRRKRNVRFRPIIASIIFISIFCIVFLLISRMWTNFNKTDNTSLISDGLHDVKHKLERINQLARRHQNVINRLRHIIEQNSSSIPGDGHHSMQVAGSNDYLDGLLYDPVSEGKSIDLYIPSMFQHLPHLFGKTSRVLSPAFSYSQGVTGVFLVIGITSIKRPYDNQYILNTIESLMNGFGEEQEQEQEQEQEGSITCMIVVCVTELLDQEYSMALLKELQLRFSDALTTGRLEVIVPPSHFYPSMTDLKEQHGDNMKRVRWRTKQNLDYSYLMLYARSKGAYYLQLEDDVIAKPNYLTVIKNFIEEKKSIDWVLLEFSHLGFIGKLFRTEDLPMLIDFFLMFYRDKPVDWLLNHFVSLKACSPNEQFPFGACDTRTKEVRIRCVPSVFQHVGVQSSLLGKRQILTDKDFHGGSMTKSHQNPPATLFTSLTAYEHFVLERAYSGDEIFWAKTPKAGDVILITFTPPIVVGRYLFQSGNSEHPGDKFTNTTLEILTPKALINEMTKLANNSAKLANHSDNGFLFVNRFDEQTGKIEGSLNKSVGAVQAMRLTSQSDGNAWVLLCEIYIENLSKHPKHWRKNMSTVKDTTGQREGVKVLAPL